MGYHAEFGCSRSIRVYVQVAEYRKNWGSLGSSCLGMDGDWPFKNKPLRPPHMCYHAQFGRSSLKSVVIDTGELHKLGERWRLVL